MANPVAVYGGKEARGGESVEREYSHRFQTGTRAVPRKEEVMNLRRYCMAQTVAIAALICLTTMVRAQGSPDGQPPVPPATCACAPQALCETAIVASLDGEKAALDLVAGIPGPLPTPGLLDISGDFRKIGHDLTELRSLRLYASAPDSLALPANDLLARSLQAVATLPVPLPNPGRGAVAGLPGPLPRTARETIAISAELIADIPGPLPQPLQLAIRRSLLDVASLPIPLPEPARQILLLSADLVADLPGPLPQPTRQRLLSLTQQLLLQSAVERLTLLEQKIGAAPEAAPLAGLQARLKEDVLAISRPFPCSEPPCIWE